MPASGHCGKTDYDQLWQQAVQQGFIRPDKTDAHVNSEFVYGIIAPKTEAQYRDMLRPWEAYKRNNPGKTQDPNDLVTLKHFVRFLAISMKGRTTEDNPNGRPTVLSVRNNARKFISSYNRENADKPPIPDEHGRCITAYIQGPLKKELGLIDGKQAQKPKKFFTSECYLKVQGFSWSNDWYTYTHEGARVDATNMINTHCYTSARLQEVCQARYRDIMCIVGYYKGEPDIRVRFTREYCKGKNINQPEHPFAERWNVDDEDYPALLAQPLLHWLANFLSVGAFEGIQTLDELLQIRPPEGNNFRVLEFADHILNKPVFPVWSAGGRTHESRSPTSWSEDSTNLARRSGHTDGLGFHSARREILLNATNAYEQATVLQFASQRSVGVLVNHYLGPLSTVDGAATYLGMPRRTDMTQDFRTATMRYNPGLVQSLSAEDIEDVKKSGEYARYTDDAHHLQEKISTAREEDDISSLKRELKLLYQSRYRLFSKKLLGKQKAQKLNYETRQRHEEKDWRPGHFDRVKHMFPAARQRLAQTMTISAPPRSELWKQAIEDLIYLRTVNCTVAWQECFQPNGKACPVENCDVQLDSLPVARQWSHVYSCYRKQGLKRFGYAYFCFSCSSWFFTSSAWEDHCKTHIFHEQVPFRYDPVKLRNASACAGHCPVCIWRATEKPASSRFHQFLKKAVWKDHVYPCMSRFIAEMSAQNDLVCPDRRCPLSFSKPMSLWHHLQDVHSIPVPTEKEFTQLDAMLKVQPLRPEFGVRFIKTGESIPCYTSREDTSTFYDETSGGSSLDNTDQSSTSSRDRSQTPLSDLCDDPVDEGGTGASPLASGVGTPLSAAAGSEKQLIDPRLLEIQLAQENAFFPCPSESKPVLDPLSLPEIALPSVDDPMSLSDDTCLPNTSSPLPNDQYRVEKVLGKWQYRRKMYYYLRWEAGGHTLEPEENINADMRKVFDQQEFTGFHEGAHIIKWTKTRQGEEWYLVAFEGTLEKWELPDKALHQDLDRPGRPPALPRAAKGRGGKRRRKRI